MNRSDLIATLANRLPELPLKDIETASKLIIEAISQSLARGHRTEIRGFGSFSLTYCPPRVGRNPMTGEVVLVPARYRPYFKPGKELRLSVDSSADSCNQR